MTCSLCVQDAMEFFTHMLTLSETSAQRSGNADPAEVFKFQVIIADCFKVL